VLHLEIDLDPSVPVDIGDVEDLAALRADRAELLVRRKGARAFNISCRQTKRAPSSSKRKNPTDSPMKSYFSSGGYLSSTSALPPA